MFLHLPPTSLKSSDQQVSRKSVSRVAANPEIPSAVQQQLPTLPPKGPVKEIPPPPPTQPEEKCPLCQTPLRKCLIQPEYALKTCPQVNCVYPFDRDSLEGLILPVSSGEILDNVARRMQRANVKSETIRTIVDG